MRKNWVLRVIFLMFAGRTTGVMGSDRRWMGGDGCGFASYPAPQTDSSRCRQNLWDANEVVGDGSQDEEPFHQAAPTMPGFAQTTDGLHPAKGFFDPLALDRADAIAGMAGRARVDRGAAGCIVFRDMRPPAPCWAAGRHIRGVRSLFSPPPASRPPTSPPPRPTRLAPLLS